MLKTLRKWADGASLQTDPRDEDPLFYYLFGDLAQAIGFRVEPLYEHAKSADVTIGLAPHFLARTTLKAPAERLTMYLRVFETLSKRFTGWTRVAIAIDDPLIGDPAFTDVVKQLGWSQPSGESSKQMVFVRT